MVIVRLVVGSEETPIWIYRPRWPIQCTNASMIEDAPDVSLFISQPLLLCYDSLFAEGTGFTVLRAVQRFSKCRLWYRRMMLLT